MDCGHSILDLDADVSEQAGWVLVRSLSFDGVTPATSMSLADDVTGNSYSATLNSTSGATAQAGGLQLIPSGALELDISLDDLLGASWQQAGVMLCWDITIASVSGFGNAIAGLIDGANAVWAAFFPAAWTIYNTSSGATGAATATSQRVLGLILAPTGATFYRSEAASALPDTLTRLAQASYSRNSAAPLTGIKARVAAYDAGAAVTLTIAGLRVYARYGL